MALGNPAPLGLLAFGMTTLFLMYVEMGWCETDFEYSIVGTAITLGGVGQVLVGIFELVKGSSFSFAVFCCYGFFWLGWALVFLEGHREFSTFGDASYTNGNTFFFAQWGVLTFCFWIITLRKNVALIGIFFLLWMTFFLLAAANATGTLLIKRVAGYFGFFTALGAFYTGVAELVNEEWGRMVLPGLRPIYSPQRTEITKQSIASLIDYDKKTNTLFLQFRGLQIISPTAVHVIEDAVESAILDAKAPDNKVHVVVDYQNTYISEEVMHSYWEMASGLEKKYYLSATRFHVSSFGTKDSPAVSAPVGLKRATVPSNAAMKVSKIFGPGQTASSAVSDEAESKE